MNLDNIKDSKAIVDYIINQWSHKVLANVYILNDGTQFIRLNTGNIQKNEQLIEKLQKSLFWNVWWEKSERGGIHYFKIDYRHVGYMTIPEYCKLHGVKRQNIHRNKDQYEWINIHRSKNLILKK